MEVHEKWKPITVTGTTIYSVSNLGRVRNNTTGHILKPTMGSQAHLSVHLSTKYMGENGLWKYRFRHYQVQRLVALAFIPNEHNYPEVHHIDGDKENNAIWNLRWDKRRGNIAFGEPVVVRVVETGQVFESINACARAIGSHRGSITQCLDPSHVRKTSRGYSFEKVEV